MHKFGLEIPSKYLNVLLIFLEYILEQSFIHHFKSFCVLKEKYLVTGVLLEEINVKKNLTCRQVISKNIFNLVLKYFILICIARSNKLSLMIFYLRKLTLFDVDSVTDKSSIFIVSQQLFVLVMIRFCPEAPVVVQ